MLSELRSNLGLKVLSVVIAIVLWFVVLGSRNIEITKESPLEIVTPPDLVVANDIPDRISYRLAGPRAFLRNIINRKEVPIKVNLANAKEGTITYRFFNDNIQVPMGVKVLFINPTSITLKLETLKTKDIPVKLVTKGHAQPGFKISSAELTRRSIRVKGPESRLANIQEVETKPVDLSLVKESGDKDIELNLPKSFSTNIDSELPRIHLDVVQDSANFRIRGIKVKVLTDKKFQVLPKEVNIYVVTSADELKSLVKSKIFAIADARNKGPGVYDIHLQGEVPDTIKLVKILPSTVKVTLF